MDSLLNKRRSIKGKITRLEAVVISHSNTPLTTISVTMYKTKVDATAVELDALQDTIAMNCTAADFDTHEREYDGLVIRIEALIIFFNTLDDRMPPPVAHPTADIKLPKLELPTFGGRYVDWLPFHDLFTATVHNNGSLSGAQKFQYLKSSLREEAALLIHAIPVTDGNYVEAWDILLNRFNNTREIISAHIKRLFSQPSIREQSSTALRQLINTTAECIRSLRVLKEPVQHWDAILLHIVAEKLDQESRHQWELTLTGTTRPTYQELSTFLEQRARALAASQPSSHNVSLKLSTGNRRNTVSHHGSVRDNSCYACGEAHYIFRCPVLLKAPIEERWNLIRKLSLCFNCLKKDHSSMDCKNGSCRKCNKPHNTLLHKDSLDGEPSKRRPTNEIISHVSRETFGKAQVILPTLIIQVEDATGHIWTGRALLDSGSQASFISEQFTQKLQLRRTHHHATIGGIGITGIGRSRGRVVLKLRSNLDPQFNLRTQALILSHVTENLPNIAFNPRAWTHTNGLTLADPTFNTPGQVDMLLGADVFLAVIQDGRIVGKPGYPGAFNTIYGWTVAGKLGTEELKYSSLQIQVNHCTLDTQLAKFWELEEIGERANLTALEKRCEQIFQESHSRDSHGRYIVQLPIRDNADKLGNSRNLAVRRFGYLERRLRANTQLYEEYRAFMDEYMNQNHMRLVPEDMKNIENTYYLPHHPVFKESSTTTKVRVVFDASAKTSNGLSLNDVLLTGPKLQDNLVNLLIRFRCNAIALTADIEKMYRQILIKPEDANYQRIVWRRHNQEPLQDYELITVTYGTAAAPYLATKVLQQLSLDISSKYPQASQALSKEFYMDDLLSGADDVQTALKLQDELNRATSEAGFTLRKWASNEPALLESLPSQLRELAVPLKLEDAQSIQTLGLQWTPATDYLSFTVKAPKSRIKITKRTILSDTARIFDPLGLLSPIIIRAKLLLQEMWQVNLSWDQELPIPLGTRWDAFREDVTGIEKIRVQRYIGQRDLKHSSLHGYCDASERAYAAVIYLYTITKSGEIRVNLIAAKTKVAPLKKTSLPRLELCAAVLLVRLTNLVQDSLKIAISEVHGWSDSQIVLAWIAAPSQRWKTFVANRVSEIQDTKPTIQWHHVPGSENPADCASRGITVEDLFQHSLWWHGPSSLNTFTHHHEVSEEEPRECAVEERIIPMVVAYCNTGETLLKKYSSLTTLIHVTAYVQRFICNCRQPKDTRTTGPLSREDMKLALNQWIKVTQSENFREELHLLQATKPIPAKSKLRSLTPFIDSEGLLRVGGRLRHAKISVDQKHGIILPRQSKLTDLIISHEHIRTFHGGNQLMMTSLQSRYWILGLRDAVRFHVKRCVRCTRLRARTMNQLMGDLPAFRVNPGRPFLRCGVDYAGPFNIKTMKGRGGKTFKGYICLFVCFTTRALHLELASDMSTETFLASFKRFIARRGRCSDVHSDCGSNFIGATRELKDLIKVMSDTMKHPTITRWMADEHINWHFNPPSSPHFGGLWEAGVKSVKHHLKRVIGETKLTYEEMQTILCQIEACLNSRPLTPMSSDPTDLSALTPGHFLIGDALTAIPEADFTTIKLNRLSRWQLGQQVLQHFWKRWQGEYLSRLQHRPKWTRPARNLKIGDLVLVKEDLAPTKWKMARVTQLHPGQDELVRVVTIRTADGELKRPIVKLCLLPLDN